MQHTYCRPYQPCLAALLIASENRIITVRYYFNTLTPSLSTLPTKKKEPKKKKSLHPHYLLATFVAPRRSAPIPILPHMHCSSLRRSLLALLLSPTIPMPLLYPAYSLLFSFPCAASMHCSLCLYSATSHILYCICCSISSATAGAANIVLLVRAV